MEYYLVLVPNNMGQHHAFSDHLKAYLTFRAFKVVHLSLLRNDPFLGYKGLQTYLLTYYLPYF